MLKPTAACTYRNVCLLNSGGRCVTLIDIINAPARTFDFIGINYMLLSFFFFAGLREVKIVLSAIFFFVLLLSIELIS